MQIDNGSHTDVIGGTAFAQIAEVASALIVKPSPPGGKEAVRTFSTGWINDIYAGSAAPTRSRHLRQPPTAPRRADQPIVMGQAGRHQCRPRRRSTSTKSAPARPGTSRAVSSSSSHRPGEHQGGLHASTRTVDQGAELRQLLRSERPASNITGSAVPSTARSTPGSTSASSSASPTPTSRATTGSSTTTPRLQLGHRQRSSGTSGFILTRDRPSPMPSTTRWWPGPEQLGVTGRILRTQQFPTPPGGAAGPGAGAGDVTV